MWYGNLQIGRIAAAAAVLAYHAAHHGRELAGVETAVTGPAGAYYFRTTIAFLFALSGFVLAHTLQSGSLRGFVGYRLLRLFPAYWAAEGLVVVGRGLAGQGWPPTADGLVKGLVLWPAGPGRVYYALGVEWTLVYELFLSLAIVPLAALGRRRGLGAGAGVWLLACLGRLGYDSGPPPLFPTPGQLPLAVTNVPFLLGVLAYLTLPRWATGWPWAVVGAAALLTAGELIAGPRPGWSFALQSAAAALAVGALGASPQVGKAHPLAAAGEWSYGVYLLHTPVLLAVLPLAAAAARPGDPGVVLFAGTAAFAAGAGYGWAEWRAYRWVRRRAGGRAGLKPAP